MSKILVTVIAFVLFTGFVVVSVQENRSQNEADSKESDNSTNPDTEEQLEINNESPQTNSNIVEKVSEIVTSTVSKGVTLDLSGQNLTKAPGYIFDKTSTQELNLSNNRLDGALQAEVRHLQNLRVLNLSNNQFTGVPAEVGQLAKLEVLDLSNNKLTGLPYELGNLSNLKVLNLKGNNYSTLDLGIIKEKLPASTIIKTD